MKILVTGCAGFIGMHTAKRLSEDGHEVIGVDSLNAYYDLKLKHDRLKELGYYKNFTFHRLDLGSRDETLNYFAENKPEYVIHLAAQAGVRHSVEFPEEYISNNLAAFSNVLDGCRRVKTAHLVYASSSSVYGSSHKIPFEESDSCDTPNSLYAATKKSNELMAYSYSHLYQMPITGLRYFTVYGPWGRPDMAAFLFSKAILDGAPIKVFNNGNMIRDFTYIDDIVDGTLAILKKPSKSKIPHNIFNIGNNNPVNLINFIEILEKLWGKSTNKIMMPIQPGDLVKTVASVSKIQKYADYLPKISIEDGLEKFTDWYRDYYL
jgi:UDP-glucuronate 4-epimerase